MKLIIEDDNVEIDFEATEMAGDANPGHLWTLSLKDARELRDLLTSELSVPPKCPRCKSTMLRPTPTFARAEWPGQETDYTGEELRCSDCEWHGDAFDAKEAAEK